MQKSILGLVALNVLLAGYLTFTLAHQLSRGRHVSLGAGAEATVSVEGSGSGRSRPAWQPQARASQPKTPWASVASTDLAQYAENLRRVGCPEQTIKDILLAEVNRQYAARERALNVRPDDIAPWEAAGKSDRRSGESKLRQLLEEKRTLLKTLTGVDVGIDMPTRLAGRDVEKLEGAFGALPDAARDPVRAIQEKYWAQSDDIKQRTLGYLEPEDRDEFLKIKTERRDALAQVLSPHDLQTYEIATSETAPALRTRLQGFDATDDEFRKIFDVMQPLDDKYSLNRRNPDPVDPEFTAARTKAEQDLQEAIHAALGDDRYAEYQRTRDPLYRSINQAGTDAGLSRDSILAAYQAQQQMQNDTQRILQDPNLTQEQRTQSLNDTRSAAQQRLQQILGDKAAQIIPQMPDVRLMQRYGLVPANPGLQVTPKTP